jgi:hypothetical protein
MKAMLLALAALAGAASARADDARWWVLDGAEAVFPVGVRELPAVARDGATVFAFGIRNDRAETIKCDLTALVDESDGDDVLTEAVPLEGKVVRSGRAYQLHAAIADEDVPEGYHLVLGSQRLVGTCLGLAAGTAPAEAPAPSGLCAAANGCLATCQAAPDGRRCATAHARWGDGRFLLPEEGSGAGPEVGFDLYENAPAQVYLGPKTGPRVCAGRVTVSADTDVALTLPRKVLRSGRSVVAAVGGAKGAPRGGSGEVFCTPYAGGEDLPDPEAAYLAGVAGSERLAADAAIFAVTR